MKHIGHPLKYYWPPLAASVPVSIGYLVGATSPETFRYTHGYFEIAAMLGFFGAIFYSFRLFPVRRERAFVIPFFLNVGLVLLVLGGGLISFVMTTMI